MKYQILLAITFFMASFSYAQNVKMSQEGTDAVNYFSIIPYEEVAGKIIVTVEIKGKKRRFILDTGAPNVISKDLLEELNLKVLSKNIVGDQSGKKDSVQYVRMDDVLFGDISFKNIETMVSDASGILKCFNVDGLIGSNMLKKSIVQFSSKNKTITITDNKAKLSLNPKQSSKLYFSRHNKPHFFLKLKNKASKKELVLFDTGSNAFFDLALTHFEKFDKFNLFESVSINTGVSSFGVHGLGKDSIEYRIKIPEINLNGAILQSASGTTTTSKGSRIGAPLLNYGIVTVDYKNKKFYFEPFTLITDASQKNWGFSRSFKDNKFVIGNIWRDDLKNQLEVGDQIVAIEDVNYEFVNLCDLLTKSPFGEKISVKLTVKDKNGPTKEVIIQKR